MVKLITSLALVLCTVSFPAHSLPQQLPHLKAPLQNVDGQVLTLEDIKKDKGLLLIFASNHCPFVKAWIDRIVHIGNEALDKNIGVVMINSNDPEIFPEDNLESMQALHKAKEMKFPYVVDSTSNYARRLAATRTPEVFLFNEKGRLVYHGAIDDNADDLKEVRHPYLKSAINNLFSGEKIKPEATKFIGCSIRARKKP